LEVLKLAICGLENSRATVDPHAIIRRARRRSNHDEPSDAARELASR